MYTMLDHGLNHKQSVQVDVIYMPSFLPLICFLFSHMQPKDK